MGNGAFDFAEQLDFGKEWEKRATDHLRELFTSVAVSNVDYSQRPELQRAGIDTIFAKSEPTLDIKCQRHEYAHTGNLPIEVVSVMEQQEAGWFWDSDADLVAWVYPNKPVTNLYKTGYLMPLTDGLREWFKDRAEEYKFITVPNHGRYGEYETGCRLVPIDDFPPEYLIEFDPRLPTDRETPQSDITAWVDGGVDQ